MTINARSFRQTTDMMQRGLAKLFLLTVITALTWLTRLSSAATYSTLKCWQCAVTKGEKKTEFQTSAHTFQYTILVVMASDGHFWWDAAFIGISQVF